MAFESLSEKLNAAFKKLRGKGRLSPADIKEAMHEVRMALLEADVSYKTVKEFTKTVTERASGADVLEALSPAQMVIKIVNEELCALMGNENQKLNISSKLPSVVMLVGLQGAGKTTNGAKLAGYIRKQGKRPLLAACDIYRPAAIKQLETVRRHNVANSPGIYANSYPCSARADTIRPYDGMFNTSLNHNLNLLQGMMK